MIYINPKYIKMALMVKALILLLTFVVPFGAYAAEIWVSPTGADSNPGTKEQPMASVTMALRKARELRRLSDPSIAGGIRIIFRGGVYPQWETLLICPEDSGTPASPTVFEAASGEYPVISGGVPVSNWRKPSGQIPGLPRVAQGKVWVADAPIVGGRNLEFRQMWVNGEKAIRSCDREQDNLNRILSWDKEKQEIWIPLPENKAFDPGQMEMVILQRWAVAFLRIKSIDVQGNKARLTFHQPESRIQFEHPWPEPVISKENGNSAYFLSNAVQFLDSPGEWFQEYPSGRIIYWPKQGEDMRKATVIAPALETLVEVSGVPDRPVSHVHFKGIGFEHTTWMRPSQAGHVALQTGMFMYDAYKLKVPGLPEKAGLENQAWIGRPPAGVLVKGASYLRFERCKFKHMASTGLDLEWATHHNVIEGNVFKDIAGNGLLLGAFPDKGYETHLPYDPADEREVCAFEKISNNLITDVTNEDWGCVGIGVGFAHNINIEHNVVSHVYYTGISLGWGWTKHVNCMKNNRVYANHIHHFAKQMYDVGGIYTLSAQPNTDIFENSIHDLMKAPYAHDPNHYQFIYFDEGSSYIRAFDNWTPIEKFFANSNGPGTEWKNNGPMVSEEIKNRAGLQPEFKDLLEDER